MYIIKDWFSVIILSYVSWVYGIEYAKCWRFMSIDSHIRISRVASTDE